MQVSSSINLLPAQSSSPAQRITGTSRFFMYEHFDHPPEMIITHESSIRKRAHKVSEHANCSPAPSHSEVPILFRQESSPFVTLVAIQEKRKKGRMLE